MQYGMCRDQAVAAAEVPLQYRLRREDSKENKQARPKKPIVKIGSFHLSHKYTYTPIGGCGPSQNQKYWQILLGSVA